MSKSLLTPGKAILKPRGFSQLLLYYKHPLLRQNDLEASIFIVCVIGESIISVWVLAWFVSRTSHGPKKIISCREKKPEEYACAVPT